MVAPTMVAALGLLPGWVLHGSAGQPGDRRSRRDVVVDLHHGFGPDCDSAILGNARYEIGATRLVSVLRASAMAVVLLALLGLAWSRPILSIGGIRPRRREIDISWIIRILVVVCSTLVGSIEGNLLEVAYKAANLLVTPLFMLFFMAFCPLGNALWNRHCSCCLHTGGNRNRLFQMVWLEPCVDHAGVITSRCSHRSNS